MAPEGEASVVNTGEWLRAARQRAGLSLEESAFRLRLILPEPYWVSYSTIQRLERRADPDPVLVAALATVFGVALEDLPAEVAGQVARVRALLGVAAPSSGCLTAGSRAA